MCGPKDRKLLTVPLLGTAAVMYKSFDHRENGRGYQAYLMSSSTEVMTMIMVLLYTLPAIVIRTAAR